MAIGAGELNKPCRFYRPNRERDAGGANTVPGGEFVGMVWGRLRGLSSGEQIQGDAVTTNATFELTLRHDRRIASDQKVLIDGKWYELDGLPVDPDGMSEIMQVLVHPCAGPW